MTQGWLRGLVAASCLSVVLAALTPGTGLDAFVGSPSIAEAATAPVADGRVVDPGYALEVGKWHRNSRTKHYYAQVDGLTWVEAEAYAVRLGGHLVTINNKTEEDWLVATFGIKGQLIGFNDRAHKGKWVWSSGEPVTYVHYPPGQPKRDKGQGPEDATNLERDSDGHGLWWADVGVDNAGYPAILEVSRRPTTGWIAGNVTTDYAPWSGGRVEALTRDSGNQWVVAGSATTDAGRRLRDQPPPACRLPDRVPGWRQVHRPVLAESAVRRLRERPAHHGW